MSDGVIRTKTSEKPSSSLPVKPIVTHQERDKKPLFFSVFFEKVEKNNRKRKGKKRKKESAE